MDAFLDILHQSFPSVFPDGAPECGYSIGHGWFPLVWEASRRLEALNRAYPERTPSVAAQVKEKFGCLRFYVDHDPALSDGDVKPYYEAVALAEQASRNTCEDCGGEGKLWSGGWLRTLCERCHKAWKAR